MPAWDKLCLRVRRKPEPSIASVELWPLHRGDVLLLCSDESPNLVDLEPLAIEALEHTVLIPSRRLASVHNELADCRLAETRHACDSADAHALAEELKGLGAIAARQLVHISDRSEGISLCQAKKPVCGSDQGSLPRLA
jgi:hypothetical protein